jgi:tRNA nucleotidyltransferase/poly(A) polymerase
MKSSRSVGVRTGRIRQLIPRTKVMRAVIATARESGVNAYLVGGPLRDLLLGLKMDDVDIAIAGDVQEFGDRLRHRLGGEFIPHDEFETGTLQLKDGQHVDLARTRTEVYDRPAKLPRVFAADIESDLKRRDFTVNAMAWDLVNRRLVDPLGGIGNLKRRTIRVLHERSFDDDPTRIFRAVRFSVRLRFAIEPGTERLMASAIAGGRLRLLAGERILNELRLILKEIRAPEIVDTLNHYGVFAAYFGDGVPAAVRRGMKRGLTDPALRLTYLLSVLGNLDKLPLTREVLADIDSLRAFPARREQLRRSKKPSATYAILKPLTHDALRVLLAVEGEAARCRVASHMLFYDNAQPMLRGNDLKVLGIPPGPIYTEILDQLRAARLDGKVKTRNNEMAMVKQIIARKEVAGAVRGDKSARQ